MVFFVFISRSLHGSVIIFFISLVGCPDHLFFQISDLAGAALTFLGCALEGLCGIYQRALCISFVHGLYA